MAVFRCSDETLEECMSDFAISVNSLRRWMRLADIADGLAAGSSDGGLADALALRRDAV